MSTTALERRPQTQGAVSAIERMSPEQLRVVKDTVARGASDVELAMFLELANRYQLDPFAKEIWCICELNDDGSRKLDKSGEPKPAMIQTSRDGYLAIANRHPAYSGMTSDVVREGDQFARKGLDVEHSYGAKRGTLIGAYALVYRRDRDLPAFFFAPWAEYGRAANQSWSPWAKYPSAMIVKVAEAMALRRAFSISGLVTQEEMDASDIIEVQGRLVAPPAEPWRERWEAVRAAAATAGIDLEVLTARLKADHGIERPSGFDDEAKYAAVMAELRGPEHAEGEALEGEVVDAKTGEVAEAEPAAEPEQQVIDQAWEDTKRRPEDPG
jgi:phage recombination protein Bet